MDELYFYKGTGVSVTKSTLVSDDRSFAINDITSARVNIIKPNKILSVLLTIAGIALCFVDINILIAIAIIIAGVGLFFVPKKPRYAARIVLNGKEVNGMTSADKAYVQIVVDAINAAVAQKGL